MPDSAQEAFSALIDHITIVNGLTLTIRRLAGESKHLGLSAKFDRWTLPYHVNRMVLRLFIRAGAPA